MTVLSNVSLVTRDNPILRDKKGSDTRDLGSSYSGQQGDAE